MNCETPLVSGVSVKRIPPAYFYIIFHIARRFCMGNQVGVKRQERGLEKGTGAMVVGGHDRKRLLCQARSMDLVVSGGDV